LRGRVQTLCDAIRSQTAARLRLLPLKSRRPRPNNRRAEAIAEVCRATGAVLSRPGVRCVRRASIGTPARRTSSGAGTCARLRRARDCRHGVRRLPWASDDDRGARVCARSMVGIFALSGGARLLFARGARTRRQRSAGSATRHVAQTPRRWARRTIRHALLPRSRRSGSRRSAHT
jgi:hypothetical protein